MNALFNKDDIESEESEEDSDYDSEENYFLCKKLITHKYMSIQIKYLFELAYK